MQNHQDVGVNIIGLC